MRVLLIEDDVTIARLLKEGLEDEAYAVDVVHDGDEGYRTAVADDYDVIIFLTYLYYTIYFKQKKEK